MQAHSSESRRKKVAVYIRMSTDQQQDSPERQRSQINPFSEKKGYDIIGEYVDLGISGARSDRPNFQRLLADAQKKKFDLIVVDSTSRLSRQEPIDYVAEVLYPLKAAGVMVDSVAEGIQDPGNLAGMILTVVQQSKSAEYLSDLSYNVLTGLLRQARNGHYVPTTAPYGYRIEGHGKNRQLVLGPPEEVRAVRWMFDMMANHGWSTHAIAQELTRRAVPLPVPKNGIKCSAWHVATVRKILRNRRYLGDCVWGERSMSNLHEVYNGEVITARGTGSRPNADMVIVPATHPAIIDRDTFQRVQEALIRRRRDTCPKPHTEKHVLSRLLVCGDCGAFLTGCNTRGERFYRCSTYINRGKLVCSQNKVWERDIVPILVDEIQRQYLNPESLARLKEQLLKDLEESRQSGEADRIQGQIATLEKQIEKANVNVLLVDPSLVRGLSDTIVGWENEVAALRESLAELSKGEHTIEEEIAMAEEWLWRLRDALTSGSQADIRAVMEKIIDRVELFFTHRERGSYRRDKLERGVIILKMESSDLVTPPGCHELRRKPYSRV